MENIKLPKLLLAPMAGVTNHAFRRICRKFGAELTYTEMVSAKAIHYKDRKTADIAELKEDDLPTAVQIFGSEPEIMAEAARLVSENGYAHCKSRAMPAFIDINMGCPAPKVANNGDGSALLKSPELAEKIVRECVRASSIPVTVKIRIGWDEAHINGVEIAKRMEDAGASAIAVHGRTKAGMFSSDVNFEEIARIKEAVEIPVVGNGGIFTADDAEKMFSVTNCDAIMLGRGVIGEPWLFSEISARLNGENFIPPSTNERIEAALENLRVAVEDAGEGGERLAVLQSRGVLAHYLKGIRDSARVRSGINSAKSYYEVEQLLKSLL